MTDFKSSIKIEMEFMGIKDKIDMFINYSPNDCCNLDSRVVDFFNGVYRKGMVKYDEGMQQIKKEQEEREERKELERLKRKYEKQND